MVTRYSQGVSGCRMLPWNCSGRWVVWKSLLVIMKESFKRWKDFLLYWVEFWLSMPLNMLTQVQPSAWKDVNHWEQAKRRITLDVRVSFFIFFFNVSPPPPALFFSFLSLFFCFLCICYLPQSETCYSEWWTVSLSQEESSSVLTIYANSN